MRLFALLGLLALGGACASAPPNLSPAASVAWRQHEVQKDLDLLRDVAQDANAQRPPLVSTAAARAVTLYHQTAIRLVHDAPAGWKAEVVTGLDGLKASIPAAEYAVVGRYVDLVRAILKEIQ